MFVFKLTTECCSPMSRNIRALIETNNILKNNLESIKEHIKNSEGTKKRFYLEL